MQVSHSKKGQIEATNSLTNQGMMEKIETTILSIFKCSDFKNGITNDKNADSTLLNHQLSFLEKEKDKDSKDIERKISKADSHVNQEKPRKRSFFMSTEENEKHLSKKTLFKVLKEDTFEDQSSKDSPSASRRNSERLLSNYNLTRHASREDLELDARKSEREVFYENMLFEQYYRNSWNILSQLNMMNLASRDAEKLKNILIRNLSSASEISARGNFFDNYSEEIQSPEYTYRRVNNYPSNNSTSNISLNSLNSVNSSFEPFSNEKNQRFEPFRSEVSEGTLKKVKIQTQILINDVESEESN